MSLVFIILSLTGSFYEFQNFRFLLGKVGACDKMQTTGSNSKSKLLTLLRKAFPDFIPQRLTSAVKSKMWCVHPCHVRAWGRTHFGEIERGTVQPAFCYIRTGKK